ncbi:sugar ABC transporter permease [Kineococcus glutinatus]|uniref:Sugar ABC transporter permease n=1 Tax=Kineococcus glutinatus TaxID=1070872 RepID=A0ABP9HDG2_9ACTN
MPTGTTAPGEAPARRRRPAAADRAAPYLFIAPFLLSFALFFLIPSASSAALSLFSYRGYGEPDFVGLRNYASLLGSPDFRLSVANTVFYWLVPLIPLVVGGFLLAVLVRSRLTIAPGALRPVYFVPQVMAPVAAALVWRVMFSSDGVVNSLLPSDVDWLTDPTTGRWSVAALIVWRGIGWYFVVFLAGLASVPDETLEAATVDGANAWQRLVHVTVPLMRPIFLFAVVIDTIQSLQLFTEPNLLLGTGTAGIAPRAAAPLMNQVVLNIQGGQFGLASAVGWMMFAAIAVVSAIQFRLLRERA